MSRLTLTALLVLGLLGGRVRAQQVRNDWTRVGDAKGRAEGQSLVVERGVFHLSRLLTNGVVEFDYRGLDQGSEATLWLRSMFSEDGRVGYQVDLLPGRSGRAVGRLRSARASLKLTETAPAQAATTPGSWRHVVVSLQNDELAVTIDGSAVVRAINVSLATGFLAIEGREGSGVEIRNLRAARIPWSPEGSCERTTPDSPLDPTLTLPKLLREVPPAYTPAATMQAVEGTVLLRAVIRETGAVGDLCVTESLHEDLDESALAHASRWLFKPAMRDGKPVAVRVQIQMDFKLIK